MNGSIFSRLMKRVFAGEYAAMQREHDIDITAYPIEPEPVPSLAPISAPLVPQVAAADRRSRHHPSSVH